MTTYEKLVEGATKIKLAPPKPKYIEPILMATADGLDSENFRVVMRTLNKRLQDTAWSIVYKSLVVIHILIKEGDGNITLAYLAQHLFMFEDLKILNTNGKFISNGGNLSQLNAYNRYLHTRAKEYKSTRYDFVKKSKDSRLRKLSVEKGLLREIESVQKQIESLLRCKFRESEVNNDVLILSFRMLITDLLSLYQTLNEGVLNLLEHFFELSRVDCQRALKIYKIFTSQTTKVIDFLRVAKHLEHLTKLHIPTIKHAQTGLTEPLEEYLNDPYFESNRRQYLAEQGSKKEDVSPPTKGLEAIREKTNSPLPAAPNSQPLPQQQQQQQAQQETSQPVVENQTQPLEQRVLSNGLVFQATGFNPFTQLQQVQQQPQPVLFTGTPATVQLPQPSQFSGALNGAHPNSFSDPLLQQAQFTAQQNTQNQFTTQPNAQTQQQQLLQQQQQQQLQSTATGFGFGTQVQSIPQPQQQLPPPLQLNTNGAAFQAPPLRTASTTDGFGNSPITQQPLAQNHSLQANITGRGNLHRLSTNPFAISSIPEQSELKPEPTKNPFSTTRFGANSSTSAFTFEGQQQQPAQIKPTLTGTNPFRSAAVPTQPQTATPTTKLVSQPTAGGLENLPTVPVFPETIQQQKQAQLLQNANMQLQQGKLVNSLTGGAAGLNNNPFGGAVPTNMPQQTAGYNPFNGAQPQQQLQPQQTLQLMQQQQQQQPLVQHSTGYNPFTGTPAMQVQQQPGQLQALQQQNTLLQMQQTQQQQQQLPPLPSLHQQQIQDAVHRQSFNPFTTGSTQFGVTQPLPQPQQQTGFSGVYNGPSLI